MSIKANDWVRSYSAGIWRVVREVPDHYEPRCSPHERKQLFDGPLFMVKRLVNNKWKLALEIESVHGSFVRPLNQADTKKLNIYLSDRAETLDAFNAFDRPLQYLLNIGFALKRKADIPKLRKEMAGAIGDISAGVTSEAIMKAIGSTSFADTCGEFPQSATLQFVNTNYEIRRRELIFREMTALNF